MKSYIAKKNLISSAVSQSFRYRHTENLLLFKNIRAVFYFLFYFPQTELIWLGVFHLPYIHNLITKSVFFKRINNSYLLYAIPQRKTIIDTKKYILYISKNLLLFSQFLFLQIFNILHLQSKVLHLTFFFITLFSIATFHLNQQFLNQDNYV